jgi:hypothetical protein
MGVRNLQWFKKKIYSLKRQVRKNNSCIFRNYRQGIVGATRIINAITVNVITIVVKALIIDN